MNVFGFTFMNSWITLIEDIPSLSSSLFGAFFCLTFSFALGVFPEIFSCYFNSDYYIKPNSKIKQQ